MMMKNQIVKMNNNKIIHQTLSIHLTSMEAATLKQRKSIAKEH